MTVLKRVLLTILLMIAMIGFPAALVVTGLSALQHAASAAYALQIAMPLVVILCWILFAVWISIRLTPRSARRETSQAVSS